MAEDKQKPDQPTQKTAKGHEVPVPTRRQVFRDLEKVAKPTTRKRGKPSGGQSSS
jgi:hypothetical protein